MLEVVLNILHATYHLTLEKLSGRHYYYPLFADDKTKRGQEIHLSLQLKPVFSYCPTYVPSNLESGDLGGK